MNVYFETFGCRLNRAESLEDEARCLALGHRLAKTHHEADAIVVRGCSVTRKAQHDCERLIARLKERFPTKPVYITGCLKGAKPLPFRQPAEVGVPTSTARAYLKVQDGCNRKCTYCIIPSFRGASRSVPWDEVLDKAKRFIDAGYHELVVTGCNLAEYRDGTHHLAELTDALAALDPGCRIRLGSVEPSVVAQALVDVIAERTNVCRFLHLAIQSGSDHVLAAMQRGYRARDVHELAAKYRRLLPLGGLGADFIAGFPVETQLDHSLSVDLIRQHQITNVHAFPFSARPGTSAENLRPQLDAEVRSTRAREIANAGETQRKSLMRRLVDRRVDVVIEAEDALMGWTGEYLPFRALNAHVSPGMAARKKLMPFIVTEVRDGLLRGASL